MIRPLFIWVGGKKKMVKHYAPFLPQDTITSYSEPFFGGGSMFLTVMKRYHPKRVWMNDRNSDLIGIYRSVKDQLGEFCTILEQYFDTYMKLSLNDRRSYYYDVRQENAEDYEKWSDVHQSSVQYFLLKVGFNGLWQVNSNTNYRYGTSHGGCKQRDMKQLYNRRNIQLWHQLMNSIDTVITDKDWSEIPMGDFTFYDPPYRGTCIDYNFPFPDSETEKLIQRVEEHRNVWVCNRDCGDGFFENRQVNIVKFDVTYVPTGNSNRKTSVDLLLYN